jgi:class 3 adenylate cyclase
MPELPTGTVTFLFTDVEGSTRLWQEFPEVMKSASARHDEIVRAVIAGHGGYVVKTTGDGFHAAFGTAHDAIDVAVAAQVELGRESWEATGRWWCGLGSTAARRICATGTISGRR